MKEIWTKIEDFLDLQPIRTESFDKENIAVGCDRLHDRFGGLKETSEKNSLPEIPNDPLESLEIVAIELHCLEQIQQVIDALLAHQSVLLNLQRMVPDEAQRALDLISGSTYALDGHQELVGESVFLFTPSHLKVSRLC